jgi:outer membrane protein OmpA-like peptidoglycan-associated protein
MRNCVNIACKRKLSYVGIIFGLVLSLSACSGKMFPYPPGVTTAQLEETDLLRSIRGTGVRIIRVGQVTSIIIPTDAYFRPHELKLRSDQEVSMVNIAEWVKKTLAHSHRPRVWVSGYTDTVYSRSRRKRLSYEYAQAIAAYLWAFDIPAKVMRVKGFGAKHAIADNRHPLGAKFNRRVVIRID